MPVRDNRLRSRAYAAMTGGAARSFGRSVEPRPGLGLRWSGRAQAMGYGRMGRNVFEGWRAKDSYKDHAELKV